MSVRCPVCGEELATDAELTRHDHHVPGSLERSGAGFSCHACGAELDSEDDLLTHEITVHTGWVRGGWERGSRVHASAPRDHRPPRQWPQG